MSNSASRAALEASQLTDPGIIPHNGQYDNGRILYNLVLSRMLKPLRELTRVIWMNVDRCQVAATL